MVFVLVVFGLLSWIGVGHCGVVLLDVDSAKVDVMRRIEVERNPNRTNGCFRQKGVLLSIAIFIHGITSDDDKHEG